MLCDNCQYQLTGQSNANCLRFLGWDRQQELDHITQVKETNSCNRYKVRSINGKV